ncbi:MAG TPA: CoA ester lyase [Candidatus Methylomirabilis sp.]|nr:CoA ester lyase [Candidatus Methylomirabilis sp.]
MSLLIRRSTLILPVNVPRFVEKAHLRGADAVMLDLEDAVPLEEKDTARRLVRDALALVARGGAEVLVRVNNDPSMLARDLEASVHPGLDGVCFPKTESAEEVRRLDARIADLERGGGIAPGRIELCLLIESPRGLLNLEAIAAASPRTRSISLGPEDYCLTLGVEPSADGMELFYGVSKVVTVCKASGVSPMGLLGSIAGFRDLGPFARAASRARDLGCEGASCIHPDQVAVLNRVFSPPPEKVKTARAAVEAFEEGLKRGTASVNVAGEMVDIPVYRRAKRILEHAAAIAAVDQRKVDALARSR